MKKPIIVLCHGWGFDSHYWKNLIPLIEDFKVLTWDLGYFGVEYCPLPEQNEVAIGIGHSIGLIKLMANSFPWAGLIGVQSFYNFLGNNEFLRARRLGPLVQMEGALAQDPVEALRQSYTNCGVSSVSSLANQINVAYLQRDLKLLHEVHKPPSCPTLVLGSCNDPIVPVSLLNDNFGQSNDVQVHMHERGQHGLGYLEPEFVADQIRNFINDYCNTR